LKNSEEPITTTSFVSAFFVLAKPSNFLVPLGTRRLLEEKNIAGMFGKVIAKRRDSTLGWSIKINIMAIRSQAIDTSMEGSETTGEVEPS
jgi:hypothetical protein